MSLFDVVAALLAIAGAIAFLNYRFAKLPSTVAMLASGLLGALAILAIDRVSPQAEVHGESLLNDGVGMVVFTALLGMAAAPGSVSGAAVALLFAREVRGGVVHVSVPLACVAAGRDSPLQCCGVAASSLPAHIQVDVA